MTADRDAELRAAADQLPESHPARRWVDVVIEVDDRAVTAAIARKLLAAIAAERGLKPDRRAEAEPEDAGLAEQLKESTNHAGRP